MHVLANTWPRPSCAMPAAKNAQNPDPEAQNLTSQTLGRVAQAKLVFQSPQPKNPVQRKEEHQNEPSAIGLVNLRGESKLISQSDLHRRFCKMSLHREIIS